MNTLLIVGGADTSRAPMAAALLRRTLERQGKVYAVASAGVLGHDGDSPEVEARDAMVQAGLDIGDHRARSITDELVAEAALLLAIDSGTALVLRARFPEAASRVYSLGQLAGRQRDIPDPFRMHLGAWMTYARELDALLEAAVPRLAELLPLQAPKGGTASEEPPLAPPIGVAAERAAAVERVTRLLQLMLDMPGVVDWTAARAQVEAALAEATAPEGASDLAAAYGGLLRAALSITGAAPSAGQLGALRQAIEKLRSPIGQTQVVELSAQLAAWPGL